MSIRLRFMREFREIAHVRKARYGAFFDLLTGVGRGLCGAHGHIPARFHRRLRRARRGGGRRASRSKVHVDRLPSCKNRTIPRISSRARAPGVCALP